MRQASGLTLREVAERLNRSHSYVAKCENGHNRVDVAQMYEFCRVFGVPFSTFATDLERRVEADKKPVKRSPGKK
ncbi:MAG: helix-turn-helix transcriptional regulator [Abitibacteriaceae bacterium]|nr:helix-turn-helix transcriptional regulator [Abditibacteriaceae bacterium]